MSSSHEPSVETLTAEVRVLQVGPGQVTLSAARQLDYADPSEIEPFGRVRIDPSPAGSLIEVIGSANGALARSSARFDEIQCPGYATPDPSGFSPASVCPEHRQTGRAGAGHRHTWTKYAPSRELYDAWESLPLIILAGLG